MKKSEYAKYLQSEHWQTLRKDVLQEYPYCERCKLPRWLAGIAYDQDLHVHHLTYANLGSEDWLDLQVLCRHCHEIETFGRTDLRPVKSTRCELCGERHYDRFSARCRTCERVFDPPELYELLELAEEDGTPLCFLAADATCAILRQHGIKIEGAVRFMTERFKKIEDAGKANPADKDEVPF